MAYIIHTISLEFELQWCNVRSADTVKKRLNRFRMSWYTKIVLYSQYRYLVLKLNFSEMVLYFQYFICDVLKKGHSLSWCTVLFLNDQFTNNKYEATWEVCKDFRKIRSADLVPPNAVLVAESHTPLLEPHYSKQLQYFRHNSPAGPKSSWRSASKYLNCTFSLLRQTEWKCWARLQSSSRNASMSQDKAEELSPYRHIPTQISHRLDQVIKICFK